MRKLLLIIILMLPLAGHSAPQVDEIMTPSGFKIWAVKDTIIPAVSLDITFTNAGTKADKVAGTANLVSALLNEGAGEFSGTEFREELEKKAITLSFSYDKDNFYIHIKTLSENLEEALRLAALALYKAKFEEDSIQNMKTQTLAVLKKLNEKPEYLANEKFFSVAYPNHAYGKSSYGTEAQIKKISRKDLVEFTKKNFTEKNMIISLVGDYDRGSFPALFDKYFAGNNKTYQAAKQKKILTSFLSQKSTNIYMNIPQTAVVFGFEGPTRNDPDFFPAFVLNYIIGGGGFEARLMNEIREKRGLAYDVDTSLMTFRETALFRGAMGTRADKAKDSIEILKQEIKKLQETGVSDDELSLAKSYLTGAFNISLDSNDRIAQFLNRMQIDSLPKDYMENRNSYIESVTKNDIDRVIKRFVNPDKLLIVSTGASH